MFPKSTTTWRRPPSRSAAPRRWRARSSITTAPLNSAAPTPRNSTRSASRISKSAKKTTRRKSSPTRSSSTPNTNRPSTRSTASTAARADFLFDLQHHQKHPDPHAEPEGRVPESQGGVADVDRSEERRKRDRKSTRLNSSHTQISH